MDGISCRLRQLLIYATYMLDATDRSGARNPCLHRPSKTGVGEPVRIEAAFAPKVVIGPIRNVSNEPVEFAKIIKTSSKRRRAGEDLQADGRSVKLSCFGV